MTGFGRGECKVGSTHLVVDLRSVNHRFLDLKLRLPQEASGMEPALRKLVGQRLSRGRIDLTLKVQRENGRPQVRVDRDLLQRFLQVVGSVQKEMKLPGTVDLGTLLQIPGVLRVGTERGELEPKERQGAQAAVRDALDALCRMREREGAALQRDVTRRLRAIRRHTLAIQRRSAGLGERLSRKLRARVRRLAQGVDVDPVRLAQEVAYLADRSDVTEELVRLLAHLDSMEQLLSGKGGPAGKELDFLTQELHRETNTIHSKAGDLAIGRHALAMKSEVEKIREQIQNVE
jgi:uncharacterized protein (TIGR00255 family)